MPKIKTPRKPRQNRKDSEGGLLDKQVIKKGTQTETRKDQQKNITKHVYDPIYNSYFNQERKIVKPKDPNNHWTSDQFHENWLHLHHIQQQRTLVHQRFLEKVDWNIWELINTYNEAEYQLLVEQKIVLFEEFQELEVTYTTAVKSGNLRNKRNLNQLRTFYKHNIIELESSENSEDEYLDELLPIKTENQPSPSCHTLNNLV